MTEDQYWKAAKVLAKGCLTTGIMCQANAAGVPTGMHCALGDLLYATGMRDESLLRTTPSGDQYKILESEYGINFEMAAGVIEKNDEQNTPCERRVEVMKYLKWFVGKESHE